MSDAPDYDSYLSSKVQHEVERLRAINAELLAALEWIAEDDGGRAGECARAAIAKAKEARHG